ncbi:nucleoside hydrolase [Gordonia sp. OPL2]|uniref:nucleoside hydrolase n=1 Tax=Gordonia sp. OPL2 TaxID=2486274 RepID=UPI001655F3E8|nr:nucleoside hydrolase [Gordonia sp. OPL2]
MDDTPPVFVDTDGGLDDLVALTTLHATGRLAGVTTVWGNVSAMAAARNVTLVAPGIPVVCGARTPPRTWHPEWAHGHDGVGDILTASERLTRVPLTGDAPQAISEYASTHPGGILLCIGPLTNLVGAYRLDPGSLRRLRAIVILSSVGTDRSPLIRRISDTNTRHDPAAAAAIATATDLPVWWIGLDVSRRLRLGAADLPRTRIGGHASMRRYGLANRCRNGASPWSVPCHDLVAAAVALHPDIARWVPGRAAVRSATSVRIVVENDPTSPHQAVVDVDLEGVRALARRT